MLNLAQQQETRKHCPGLCHENDAWRLSMAKSLKVQIIERAKELIQDESRWCRGYLAVDADGISADPTSSEAVKRCAFGALLAAAYQLTNSREKSCELASNALLPLCGSNKVVLVNDHEGHAAILALFDEATAVM
jgi:hypothetical protein